MLLTLSPPQPRSMSNYAYTYSHAPVSSLTTSASTLHIVYVNKASSCYDVSKRNIRDSKHWLTSVSLG